MLWGIFVAQHCNSSKWIEMWDFNSFVILWYIFDIKHVQSAIYICLNCNFVCYSNCQFFLFKLPNLFNQIEKVESECESLKLFHHVVWDCWLWLSSRARLKLWTLLLFNPIKLAALRGQTMISSPLSLKWK